MAADSDAAPADTAEQVVAVVEGDAPAETPKPKRASRAKKPVAVEAVVADATVAEADAAPAALPEPAAEPAAKPKRASRAKKAVVAEPAATEVVVEAQAAPEPATDLGTELETTTTPPRPSRKGWWNRTFGE